LRAALAAALLGVAAAAAPAAGLADRGPAPTAAPSVAPDVVGGGPAAPGRWPYMQALVDARTASNHDAQRCGASLIDRRHALTAAHCVKGIGPEVYQVLVGTQDLASGGRRVAIERITVHPDYVLLNGDPDRDVAVLRLAGAVEDIAPVAFVASPQQERSVARAGTPAWGAGWGATGSDPLFPEQLYEAQVPIVSRARCNARYAYYGRVTKDMLCAGLKEGGPDMCGGDSGGPLVIRGEAGAADIQIGITSWGDGCGAPRKPGVYSRLGTLGAWVQQQIDAP
jgi:trypsin